jgi:hypothetical protein
LQLPFKIEEDGMRAPMEDEDNMIKEEEED